MRLNAFILALCVCLYQVMTASITAPDKHDDLDNVDLDTIEPDIIDQPSILDIDNNLRKNIFDIPVKVIQESNLKVLDENSNDYVPNNDDSLNIKRLEIDLANPGPPQRQTHETQNPESYGDREKAIFAIKQSIDDTQNIFNSGLKSVSNSFKTLFAANEDLPAIQQNIQNLRQTFEGQIEKLNTTIRSYFKQQIKPSEGASIDPDLEIVNSGLRNLENNFKSGVDTLTEGVEVLSILREEDEAARAEGTPEQTGTPDASAQPPAPTNPVQNPAQITQPVMGFLNVFQQGIVNAFNNLNNIVQNTFSGNAQGAVPQTQTGNPIVNFIQGITGGNNNQAQKPPSPAGAGEVPPAGAQSDAAVAPTSAPTPAPWSPGAIFQQVQNSIQNLINPQPNQQQIQPQPANNGPISQAFQNIVQFIRPGQGNAQQQVPQTPAVAVVPAKAPQNAEPVASNAVPANPTPANPTPANPTPANPTPANPTPANPTPANPTPANPTPAVPTPVQNQPVQSPQPGPIQQLVQNNPIIKGIQVAIHRIQNPSADTPRNEEVKENNINVNIIPKGHFGGNNNNNVNNNVNQNDIESGGRLDILPEKVEIIKEDRPVKCDKEIAEKIVTDDMKTPSISDKTE